MVLALPALGQGRTSYAGSLPPLKPVWPRVLPGTQPAAKWPRNLPLPACAALHIDFRDVRSTAAIRTGQNRTFRDRHSAHWTGLAHAPSWRQGVLGVPGLCYWHIANGFRSRL